MVMAILAVMVMVVRGCWASTISLEEDEESVAGAVSCGSNAPKYSACRVSVFGW